MSKWLGLLGATAGGWVGWTVGEHVGLLTAFVLGVVGTGAGLYAGRRIARDHFE